MLNKNRSLEWWVRKLTFFFPLCVLVFFVLYVHYKLSTILNLFTISYKFVFLLFALTIAGVLTRALINLSFYRIFSSELTFNESIGLAVLNTLANLLPLSGGFLAKGLYLKHTHHISYSHYFPATAALYVCFLGISGFIGVASLSYLQLKLNSSISIWLYLCFLLMLLSILTLFISIEIPIFRGRLKNKLREVNAGWQSIRRNPKILGQIILLQIAVVILVACRFLVLFFGFSQNLHLTHCILFSAATILTRLVTIVPGGFGVREGIVGSISSVFGYDFGLTALVIAIDRIVAVLITFLFGMTFSKLLGNKLLALGLDKYGKATSSRHRNSLL